METQKINDFSKVMHLGSQSWNDCLNLEHFQLNFSPSLVLNGTLIIVDTSQARKCASKWSASLRAGHIYIFLKVYQM